VLPKIAEILIRFVPTAEKVAVLINSDSPSASAFWSTAEDALKELRRAPIRFNASSEAEVVAAFDQMHARASRPR
jgi:hypothetical protein